MIASQEVLDALKQIGLNLYERKLWVALLSRGTSTAGELSSLSKVPHSRTYDVLESLADKGFVMIQSSKPLKYVAVSPNEAFERLKKKLSENLEVGLNRITKLQSSPTIKKLNKIYKKGVELIEPGEMTGSLRGRDALHQQLETCFKKAKSSISILTTIQGLSDLHLKHKKLLEKAAKRGVKIKIATKHNKKTAPIIKELKKFAEIRKADKADIMGRFCVVDKSHVVMALTDEDVHPTQDLALWSQSDHVAEDVLGPMFDFIWEKLEIL